MGWKNYKFGIANGFKVGAGLVDFGLGGAVLPGDFSLGGGGFCLEIFRNFTSSFAKPAPTILG